jgi:hypothetical protein
MEIRWEVTAATRCENSGVRYRCEGTFVTESMTGKFIVTVELDGNRKVLTRKTQINQLDSRGK